VLVPLTLSAQTKARPVPRTPDGHPDLQGIWDFRSATALERPARFAGREFMTNMQIVQTPGYVTIFTEMIHDARVVPMDGRPHNSPNLRSWMGDSRGRWEGAALVVDTTNFTDRTNFRGAGANLHLVERFTRVGADTIEYRFTLDDPTTWTKPWTVAYPIVRTDGPIYEFACHEGNYGLRGILSGARYEEKVAQDADRKKQ
jgi:hypothetical protein